jgi:hypothetical protein
MKMIRSWASKLGLVFLAFGACHSKDEPPARAVPVAEAAPQTEPSAGPTARVISSARDSLKAGNVDEAAARLAQLQLQGASFNAQQARDYRQALSDAYDRAIEAAQRGDPKGETALKLLRAAAPR